ncbi:hypothetical protein DHEL01_v211218 [Diaporthe helianthi]|uniref:Uncharacterized protein n=1 Tax=Diaporthe helianthi TaxID=158607 RepID=A0A2P5HJG1_DIAHE|nr:hypothetical protein DHEL01_v211218 [Diaporthe helianthi]
MMLFKKETSWSLNFHALFVFFTLLLNVAAQVPVLGIELDQGANDDAKRIIFSAKLTFKEDTVKLFSHAQIYGIARLAFEEMFREFPKTGLNTWLRPKSMAAMAIGNSVYISSPVKGGPYFYTYADTSLKPEVVLALERCSTSLQMRNKSPVAGQHKAQGNCAEIAALHTFYLDPEVSDADRQKRPRTRLGVFGLQNEGRALSDEIAPRKHGQITWGCNLFVTSQKIETLRWWDLKDELMELPEPFPEFTVNHISFVCPGRFADSQPTGRVPITVTATAPSAPTGGAKRF